MIRVKKMVSLLKNDIDKDFKKLFIYQDDAKHAKQRKLTLSIKARIFF